MHKQPIKQQLDATVKLSVYGFQLITSIQRKGNLATLACYFLIIPTNLMMWEQQSYFLILPMNLMVRKQQSKGLRASHTGFRLTP